jgi:hypothetical protein
MARKTKDYTPELKDKALELAASIGLKAAGTQLGVPWQTIQTWAKHPDNAERWSELRRIHAPAWRARAAIPLEDLVDEYGELQAKTLRKAAKLVDEDKLEPKDVGNFLRSIAWAQNSAGTQANQLRGHATHVTEHRIVDVAKLDAAMEQLALEAAKTPYDVESSAEEIPPTTET